MKVAKTDHGNWAAEIEGKTYEFSKWGAETALDTLLDITSVVGGPLGQAMALAFGKQGDGMDTEVGPEFAAEVFKSFTSNMRDNKKIVMDAVKKLVVKDVICNGVKVPAFDEHYQDLKHVFLVARAAFEVQFGDFFADALKSAGIKQRSKVILPSQA